MFNAIKHAATAILHRVRLAEDGQALVEYSLIMALVGLALLGALGLLSGGIENVFQTVISAL